MQNQLLVSADEFCTYHNIEFSFMRNLQEFGMIEMINLHDRQFIPEDQLENIERILRLHQDLEINIEGIDTITHLLQRIGQLQNEVITLRNKLSLYEDL